MSHLLMLCTLMVVSEGLASEVTLQFVPAKPGETPHCAQDGKIYCEQVENYPEQTIVKLLKTAPREFIELLFDEPLNQQQSLSENHNSSIGKDEALEEQLCRTKKIVFRPRAVRVRNSINEWRYIVNVEGHHQKTETETCWDPNGPCSPYLKVEFKDKTKCVQKQTTIRQLALHPSGEKLYLEEVDINSCCACSLIDNKITKKSRMWTSRRNMSQFLMLCTLMVVSEGLTSELNLQFVPAKPGETPTCAQGGKNYCEQVENYPEQTILKLLKSAPPEFIELLTNGSLFQLSQSEYHNSSFPVLVKDQFCETKMRYVMPRALGDLNNEWQYIVNVKDRNQVTRIECCEHRDKDCSSYIRGKTPSCCFQKFLNIRHLALHPSGEKLHVRSYLIPSCCECRLYVDGKVCKGT